MKFAKTLIGVTAILFLFSASAPISNAEEPREKKTIKIQVKGLACPFCAYGLEKRIKETGAEEVKIYVDKGLTHAVYPQRTPLDIEELREAVRRGGFTPGSIEVEAIGVLDQREGGWVFVLAGSGDLFLVREDDDLEKMAKEVKSGVALRIAGVVEEIRKKGHGEHPPVLKILNYEILE